MIQKKQKSSNHVNSMNGASQNNSRTDNGILTEKPPLRADRDQAERFLTSLDEEAEEFTFQTFDDNKSRKDKNLTNILHGTLDEHFIRLQALNNRGAGIFITVNKTDLKGRKCENITQIRAVFKEDDRGGTPALPLEPQMVVESSPGKRHEYILVEAEDIDVNEFKPVQQRLVNDYGSDPNAKDLVRVLRVPGFYHMKDSGNPHLVSIIQESGQQRYPWQKVTEAFPPVAHKEVSAEQFPPGVFAKEEIENALTFISPDCEYDQWLGIGMAISHASAGSRDGFSLWDEWSSEGIAYRGTETRYKWSTFGCCSEANVTQKTLFKIAYANGWKGLKLKRVELIQRIEDADNGDIDRALEINSLIKSSGLSDAEAGHVYKRIKKKFDMNIGDLKADNKSSSANAPGDVQIAEETLLYIGKDNIIHSLSAFHRWQEKGVWTMSDDLSVKKQVHELCKAKKYEYTSLLVNSTLSIMATESYQAGNLFDQQSNSINCESGELHFKNDEWTLEPHDKTTYRTTQIPHSYAPNAKADLFNSFLDDVFNGDADAEEKKTIVLEAIGYSLLSTCKYERFFLLIGGGANGKSVLLGIIEALLGRRNVTAVQPSSFGNKFQRAHLHGKLANIVTEIKEGAEIEDAQLKSIVSGELTTAEHKNKPPFDFHPFSTCWFGTNHMPHTRDFSEALFRRAVILQFNNKFEGENCDPNLKDKLIEELPGIFNLCVTAIGEVLRRGRFTECQSNKGAKEDWRMEADQCMQFIDDCCDKSETAVLTVSELYVRYTDWTDDSGIKSKLNKRNFGSRLDRLGFKKTRTRDTRLRQGLKFK
jgi:putative DNA primase/helicase